MSYGESKNTAKSGHAIPCYGTFGAKVRSAGLSHSRDETTVDALKRLWEENFVMVFRDKTFSDPDPIHFSREFDECYRAPNGDAVLNGDIPSEKAIVFNV